MENNGTDNGTECKQVETWLISLNVTFSTLGLCISTYVLFALLYHKYAVKFMKKCDVNKHRGFRDIKKYSRILGYLAIFAALFISIRSLIDVTMYTSVIYNNYHLYGALTLAQLLLNIAILVCIYTVLWFRLWIFYNHSAMAQFKSKLTIMLCWTLFIVMVGTSMGNALFFIMDRQVEMTEPACLIRHPLKWGNKKFYFLGGCTIFYQVTLLALFLFPLLMRKSIRSKGTKSKQRFINVLKRVLMVTAICCGTDLATMPFSITWDHIYIDISFLFFNINILINFTCLLFSYGDWKLRVFSFFTIRNKSTHGHIQTSSSDTGSTRRRSSSARKKSREYRIYRSGVDSNHLHHLEDVNGCQRKVSFKV